MHQQKWNTDSVVLFLQTANSWPDSAACFLGHHGVDCLSKADLTLYLLKINVKPYTSQSYSSRQEVRDLVHGANKYWEPGTAVHGVAESSMTYRLNKVGCGATGSRTCPTPGSKETNPFYMAN